MMFGPGPGGPGGPHKPLHPKSFSDFKYAFKAWGLLIKKYPIVLLWRIISIVTMTINTLVPINIVSKIVEVTTTNPNASFKLLLTSVASYVITLFVCDAIALICNYNNDVIARDFKVDVNLMLYEKLRHIDYEYHDDSHFLDNFTRALEEGAGNIYDTADKLFIIIRQFIQSVSVFTVIGKLDKLTIIYALVTAIIYVIIKYYVAHISFMMRTEMRFFIRKRMYISRTFYLKENMAEIKTTHIDDVLLARHLEAGQSQVKAVDKYGFKRSSMDIIGSFLIGSIYPVILGLVAYQASVTGEITLAEFSALTVAALSLSNLISRIVSSFTEVQDTAVECQVPFEVMELKPRIETGTGEAVKESFKSLEIRDVEFIYPGSEHPTISHVNIEIHKGEKIALVGENGAGKTTVVKLMLRLYDPQKGGLYYNGQDIKELEAGSYRKHIGAVFQNSEVYASTVGENILLRKVKDDNDIKLIYKALEFSGLKDFIDTLPEGINTYVTREFEEEGVVFSGGQRQKLAVARGFALGYDCLILDEPSSALDPLAETSLYSRMLSLGQDRTLVFISHRLSATVNADRIYLFSQGTLKEAGTHEELMAIDNGIYKRMFLSQAEKYREGLKEVEE